MPRAKATGSAATVVFQGPPDAVEAYVPVDPARRRDIRVSVAEGDGWAPVRALTAPAGGSTLVRLVDPPTAPGRDADARVEIGDDQIPAVIRTAEHVELVSTPSTLDLLLDGSGVATASLQVVNVGNVAVDLPDLTAFGIMAEGGLDASVGAGLMTKERGVDRFGRMADALAEHHGGLVRATLKASDHHLETGAPATVEVSVRTSGDLQPGRRYQGVMPIATLRVQVWLTTPESSPERPRGRPTRSSKKGAAP
jgi:hypothetical protein